jgi:hypothetical protein
MLIPLVLVAVIIYLRENPALSLKPSPKAGGPKRDGFPPQIGCKPKNMFSPLTTPISGASYIKNPRIDPVPSIYNNVLNQDEKQRFDEYFFKQRQVYTNWDDMEDHPVLDNFNKNDFPMRGAPLINGLNRKEIENPTKQYGMFMGKMETELNEEPWM